MFVSKNFVGKDKPPAEVTEMLNNQWTALTIEERQKYIDFETADKKKVEVVLNRIKSRINCFDDYIINFMIIHFQLLIREFYFLLD